MIITQTPFRVSFAGGGTDLPAFITQIGDLADDALEQLGTDRRLDRDAVLVNSDYLGEGYGLPTPATFAALRKLAGSEGLLLDPVYSGKAMSGFLGLLESGHFDDVENLVFLHTGGTASLHVYGQAILA